VAQEYDIKGMADKIRTLKQNATEPKEMSRGIQAVDRTLANVRMLELNITDVANILHEKR